MATISCKYSGIQFRCEHFSIHLQDGEACHPIFNVPLPRLFKYFPKWQQGELTQPDSYLLFLAYLHKTDLVTFRVPCNPSPSVINQIVQTNMEPLFYTIGRIITIRHPRFVVPEFVVSKQTSDLTNVNEWIKVWADAYDDFCNGLKDQDLRSKLQRKESALERLIKNPSLKPERYSHILADWASDAAAFPQFNIINPTNQTECTVSDYWKQIIRLCYQKESLLSVPEHDIFELLAHCEENLDLGSIQSYHLFNTIREGLQTVQGFYGTGPTSFVILDSESAFSDSQVELLKRDAPTSKPLRTSYPTEFAFFKAMMKWNMSTGESK